MKINSVFSVVFLIMSLFLTFSVFAQETEDVVYLKNGSIIRGVIIEMVPNDHLKIRTRDSNLLVFTMDEVMKIVKEPYIELEPRRPRVSSRRVARGYMFSPIGNERAAYRGVLLGAHSGLGIDFPMIGVIGLYDAKTHSDWLKLGSRKDMTYSVGLMSILEASPDFLWNTQGYDLQGHILVGSGLVTLGSESSSVSYRFGVGVSLATATIAGFGAESALNPTAIASATFFPKQNVTSYLSYVETFGVTLYARWQGDGAMIGIAIGLLQRGAGW